MNVIILSDPDFALTGPPHYPRFPLIFPVDRPKLFTELSRLNVQIVHVVLPELHDEAARLLNNLRCFGVAIVLTTAVPESNPLVQERIPLTATTAEGEAAYLRAGLGELMELTELTEIGPEFYGERYLEQGGYRWRGPDSTIWKTGYEGRSWDGGYGMILKGIEAMFGRKPQSALDLGTDRGGLVDFLMRHGIEAWGVDYSPWAIEHPIGEAVGRIFLEDLTKAPPPMGAELVIAFDFWEHIYEADLQACAQHVRAVVQAGTRFLFQTPSCAAPNPCRPYTLIRGHLPGLTDEMQILNYGKGHLMMQTAEWWAAKLTDCNFIRDPETERKFHEASPIFRHCPNWLKENVTVWR